MPRSLLFLITADPRSNARAAEAVRMAAGISGWGQVNVALVLHGPAHRVLGENPDELLDGDQLRQCLPLLAKHQCPVYVVSPEALQPALTQSLVEFEEIDSNSWGN